MALTATTMFIYVSIFLNAILLFWFGIVRVIYPFTVLIIKNRGKQKQDKVGDIKMADLRNFELINTRARTTKVNGIRVLKFLQAKGYKEITENLKLYPIRNIMKQEVALVLYTEDDENYEYVDLTKEGKMITLPENVRAMVMEGIKKNAKKWISNPLMQLAIQALPLFAIIGSVIILVVTVKALVPDVVAAVSPMVQSAVSEAANAIREVGCHCSCA